MLELGFLDPNIEDMDRWKQKLTGEHILISSYVKRRASMLDDMYVSRSQIR